MKKLFLRSPIIVILLGISLLFGGGLGFAIFFGGGSVNLQKGLVAHWKFDGNAKDATPNANNGTVTGAVLTTDRKGQSNKAYDFDGTDDNVNIGSSSIFDFTTGAYSILAWVNPDTLLDEQEIVFRSTGGPPWSGYALEIVTGSGVLRWFIDGNVVQVCNQTISAGVWSHVAMSRPAAGEYDLYINGVECTYSATSSVSATTNSSNLFIGSEAGAVGWGGRRFDGKIDDVRVYSRALTAAEVLAMYESYNPGVSISTLQQSLVANWKFDGNAKDATPQGNNGTVTGATLTTDRKGQGNKAYDFDGVDNKVDIANGIVDVTGAWSIAMWLNASGNTGTNDRFIFLASGSNSIEIARMDTTGSWGFARQNGVAGTSSATHSLSSWYHMVLTHTGGTYTWYTDGILETGSGTGIGASNTLDSMIGNSLHSGVYTGFFGKIDDVRVYNRVLTAAEVLAMYESYNPGISISTLQQSLVGNWKFDGNAKDATPNANNGTLAGDTVLTTDRKGQSNKAYSFDGTGDYINVSDSASLDITGAVTLSTWMYDPPLPRRSPEQEASDEGAAPVDRHKSAAISINQRLESFITALKSVFGLDTYFQQFQRLASAPQKLQAGGVYTHIGYGLKIEVQQPVEIKGGVSVLARAWRASDNVAIGFGQDGSVEWERFRIYNPPIMVPDGTTHSVIGIDGKSYEADNFKEDSVAALREVVAQTVELVGQPGAKVTPGKIGNTTSTFYPDANPESTSVDGDTTNSGQASWVLAHDASAGNGADPSGAWLAPLVGWNGGSEFAVYRSFALFDTSALGSGATISSAVLSLYLAATKDDDNDGNDFISIVASTPASNTDLVTGDFDQLGTTEQHDVGERKDITGMSLNAYLDYTLNATGLGNISLTGVTKFGIREGHDLLNSAISTPDYNYVNFRSADTAGTTQDPKLVVTYTVITPVIVGKGIDAYQLEIDGSLNITGYINSSATSSTQVTKAWHHVVMTYDGANMKLYVDGVLTVTTAKTGAIATNSTDLKLGSNMPGKLDDMRVYSRALSAAEVLAMYESYR